MLAVRWYLRFGLPYRDVEALLAERGIEVDHATIYRRVQRFAPPARRRCQALPTRRRRPLAGGRDHLKVAGQWRYAYQAVDQFGQVIDVFMSRRHGVLSARRFFEQAIGTTKGPLAA